MSRVRIGGTGGRRNSRCWNCNLCINTNEAEAHVTQRLRQCSNPLLYRLTAGPSDNFYYLGDTKNPDDDDDELLVKEHSPAPAAWNSLPAHLTDEMLKCLPHSTRSASEILVIACYINVQLIIIIIQVTTFASERNTKSGQNFSNASVGTPEPYDTGLHDVNRCLL